jgi:hypothetical protein
VSDTKTASWIAALERARAELEGALSVDAHWRAPRRSTGDADRSGHEKTFGANPVYRCWVQLSEAIVELRRQAQADASPGRPRVSLRDVLKHIHSDPTLLAEPQAAAADPGRIEAAQAPPCDPGLPATPPAQVGHAPPEAEEATVSFVIREPIRPAPVAGHGRAASAAKKATPPEGREPEPDPGAETEVVIVPRRRR